MFNNRFVCDDDIGGFPIEQSSVLLRLIVLHLVSQVKVKLDDTSHLERELFDYKMTIQYYIDIITISVPYCLFVDESLMSVDLFGSNL